MIALRNGLPFWGAAHGSGSSFSQVANRVAKQTRQAIWAHLALPDGAGPTPVDTPLHLRIHDAALILTRSTESWRENEAQLIEARAERPDDPQLAIMWGLTLYAKLVLQSMEAREKLSSEDWKAIEDEIEGGTGL